MYRLKSYVNKLSAKRVSQNVLRVKFIKNVKNTLIESVQYNLKRLTKKPVNALCIFIVRITEQDGLLCYFFLEKHIPQFTQLDAQVQIVQLCII